MRDLVPTSRRVPVNGRVLSILIEARHCEVIAIRMTARHGGSPGQHARAAYDLLNKLAGRPALLGE